MLCFCRENIDDEHFVQKLTHTNYKTTSNKKNTIKHFVLVMDINYTS